MGTISPTHACFDDALEFFDEALDPAKLFDIEDSFRVVHAVCGLLDSEAYAHAWVEQRAVSDSGEVRYIAWQSGLLDAQRCWFALDRHDLYAGYGVQHAVVYSLHAALLHNSLTGHTGPWAPEVRAAVRDGARAIVGMVQDAHPVMLMHRA